MPRAGHSPLLPDRASSQHRGEDVESGCSTVLGPRLCCPVAGVTAALTTLPTCIRTGNTEASLRSVPRFLSLPSTLRWPWLSLGLPKRLQAQRQRDSLTQLSWDSAAGLQGRQPHAALCKTAADLPKGHPPTAPSSCWAACGRRFRPPGFWASPDY